MNYVLKYFLLSVIAIAIVSPAAVKADLVVDIVNPGFEDLDGDGQFGDGWGSFGNAGFNNFFGANGHASLFADTAGNSGGVFQAGIAGVAGAEYTFTLTDVNFENNANADFSFGLEFFESDDSTLISSQTVSFSSESEAETPFVAIAPAGTVFVRPIISFSNAAPLVEGPNNSANVFVFDVALTATAVPEPSSLLLFGAAVSAAALRRRRC